MLKHPNETRSGSAYKEFLSERSGDASVSDEVSQNDDVLVSIPEEQNHDSVPEKFNQDVDQCQQNQDVVISEKVVGIPEESNPDSVHEEVNQDVEEVVDEDQIMVMRKRRDNHLNELSYLCKILLNISM